MKAFKFLFLLSLLSASLLFGQNNTWHKITGSRAGVAWLFPAIAYSPVTHEYIMTMGTQDESGANSLYSVQVFTHGLGKWINALPHDTLYGVWADSTGYTRGNGRVGNLIFGTYYWSWLRVQRYLRPNLGAAFTARAYTQYCVNSDDGKIYFYISGTTCSYDPITRLWDTLIVNTHPNAGALDGWLKWGSLCYDPVNHEVVLFGGGGVETLSGTPGTWTLNPSTRTWTKRNLAAEPTARAHSQMVYDPATQKIVLFGGDHLDGWFNDTWVYDCVTRTWSRKNPAVRPSPRAGHALLYMPKSGKIVLLGGYCSAPGLGLAGKFEMWKYDVAGNAWSLIKRFAASDTVPNYVDAIPPICGNAAVDIGDTVIATADTAPSIYGYSPCTYRLACDANVTDAGGTTQYGFTRDSIAVRGGWTDPAWFTQGVAAPDTAAVENKLRTLTLSTWTPMNPPKLPQDRYDWSTTILDPEHDVMLKWGGGHVAHCGTDVPHYSLSTNRYAIGYVPEWPLEWSGYNNPYCGPHTFNGRPFVPMHQVKSYAYDVNIHKMVFCYYNHTWLYDPDSMDWVKTMTIKNPSGAGYNTGLINTPHGVFNMWSNQPYLFSADSLRWRRLTRTGATLPTFYADNSGVVYDSQRDRVLYAQGNAGAVAALYSYDFATGVAALLSPANSTIATGNDHYRECVYSPTLDLVLFQIHQAAGHLAYDCKNNRWTNVAVAGFVSTMDDRSCGFMYDAKRNLVWANDDVGNVYAARLDAALSRAELDREATETRNLTVSPNPFNSGTALLLPATGARASHATLKVFSADGRLVLDLSRRISSATKSIAWRTAELPSGIYLVEYAAGNKVWKTRAVITR